MTMPQVSCPPDITVNSTSPSVVTYIASCTDSGGIATFACLPPSGSTFPVGMTTVTCKCVDVSDNMASCSFTVSVGTALPTATPTATPTSTGIPQGGDCAIPSQCSTGFCVDGVCCDTICDQPGQICNQAGNQGVCTVPTAPAPALTPRALLMAAALLAGLGAFALRRAVRSGRES
jgi:hypothetical protein